jgi:hypothetical protein
VPFQAEWTAVTTTNDANANRSNGMEMDINGSSVELDKSQGPIIQPVINYDMMDLD